MVDKKQLEEVYKQNLENDIINAISKMKRIDYGRHLIFIIPVNLLNKFQIIVMESKIWMQNIWQKIWLRMNRSFLDNYGMIVLEKYANALGKHIEIKICDDWQIFIQRIIYDNIKCNNIKGGMTIARKLRVWFPGATYHIMHRGVRRKPIFEDEMR